MSWAGRRRSEAWRRRQSCFLCFCWHLCAHFTNHEHCPGFFSSIRLYYYTLRSGYRANLRHAVSFAIISCSALLYARLGQVRQHFPPPPPNFRISSPNGMCGNDGLNDSNMHRPSCVTWFQFLVTSRKWCVHLLRRQQGDPSALMEEDHLSALHPQIRWQTAQIYVCGAQLESQFFASKTRNEENKENFQRIWQLDANQRMAAHLFALSRFNGVIFHHTSIWISSGQRGLRARLSFLAISPRTGSRDSFVAASLFTFVMHYWKLGLNIHICSMQRDNKFGHFSKWHAHRSGDRSFGRV